MAMEVPSGWYEVIRGPRPPSVRWPQEQHLRPPNGAERATGEGQFPRRTSWPLAQPHVTQPRFPTQPELVPTRLTPQRARVKQLHNAIDALDEKDPLVASLRAEMQKAHSKARVVPVEDRIKSTIGGKEGVGGCTRRRTGRRGPVGAVPGGGCSGSHSRRTSVNAELERLRGLVVELTRPNSP